MVKKARQFGRLILYFFEEGGFFYLSMINLS